jgi:hypothetical protein
VDRTRPSGRHNQDVTDDRPRPGHTGQSEHADLWWPPTPATIRLMGEYTVQVPLWGETGLLYASQESLVSDLGISPELASDLVAWAEAWETASGQPDHDAGAAALIRRLRVETERRFNFVYQP